MAGRLRAAPKAFGSPPSSVSSRGKSLRLRPGIFGPGLRAAMTQLGMSARAFHRTAERPEITEGLRPTGGLAYLARAKREAGADDCGPGGCSRHPDASLGGGDSIQTTQADLAPGLSRGKVGGERIPEADRSSREAKRRREWGGAEGAAEAIQYRPRRQL